MFTCVCDIIFLCPEPVKFDTPARNVTARRGESVTLSCDVRGDHPIQVYWLFNEQRIHHNNYRSGPDQDFTGPGIVIKIWFYKNKKTVKKKLWNLN
jgi:hypothetical protein